MEDNLNIVDIHVLKLEAKLNFLLGKDDLAIPSSNLQEKMILISKNVSCPYKELHLTSNNILNCI